MRKIQDVKEAYQVYDGKKKQVALRALNTFKNELMSDYTCNQECVSACDMAFSESLTKYGLCLSSCECEFVG